MKQDFIDFLVKNKAYRQYMYNLAYTEDGTFGWDLYSYETPAEDWLDSGFYWDETKEGMAFWQDLYFKWEKIIKEKA